MSDIYAFANNDHLVGYYSAMKNLIGDLGNYITVGLAENETCLVVAQPRVIGNLSKYFSYNNEASSNLKGKSFTLYNAQSVLDQFVVNGMPNRKKFTTVVGGIIKSLLSLGNSLRIYGDMVAVLWEQGNKAGALELERFWNDLAQKYDFKLFCAYPEFISEISDHEHAMINTQHHHQLQPV